MTIHDRLSALIYENLDSFKPKYDIAEELAGIIIDELRPELTRHDTGCVCNECWYNR